MFAEVQVNVWIYCIFPYLQDVDKRALYSTCRRMNKMIDCHYLADKSSIDDLCFRGDLLIIHKRKLIVKKFLYFELICKRGYFNLVKESYEALYLNIQRLNLCLSKACSGGHEKTVKFLIDKGANKLEWGLKRACHKGHYEVVDLLVKLLDNDGGRIVNWDGWLEEACRGGNHKIVNLMIKKGANKWNRGLWGACRGGHKDLVNVMIDKGADDWNYGLDGACEGGHYNIIELMIGRGATECRECGESVEDHL